MEQPGRVKVWLAQFRANFLILAVVLALIGLALAAKYAVQSNMSFNFVYALLLVIGVVAAHSSVNLFNEYSDYKTKIDFNTIRNPFSGGSGMLVEGKTKPKDVLFAAILTLVIGLSIGVYFIIVSHWTLAVLVILGAFAIVFYTNILAKMLLGELFAGLALGTLVVLGVYIAMTATPGMTLRVILPNEVILLSIPPGILTSLLLFLNEFPDAEADKQGGRLHLVIKFGKKKAAFIYTASLIIMYALIIILPLLKLTSFWVYISLLTIPIAVQSSNTAIKHGADTQKIIPALGANVMIVLATDFLIAASVFIQLI